MNTISIVGFIMTLIPVYGIDLAGGILCIIDLKKDDGSDKSLSKVGFYIFLAKIIIPLVLLLIILAVILIPTWLGGGFQ